MDDMQGAAPAGSGSASDDLRLGQRGRRIVALLLFAVGIFGLPIWIVYFATYSFARVMLVPVAALNRILWRAHVLWARA